MKRYGVGIAIALASALALAACEQETGPQPPAAARTTDPAGPALRPEAVPAPRIAVAQSDDDLAAGNTSDTFVYGAVEELAVGVRQAAPAFGDTLVLEVRAPGGGLVTSYRAPVEGADTTFAIPISGTEIGKRRIEGVFTLTVFQESDGSVVATTNVTLAVPPEVMP